jgi:Ca2+-transporting ATPase
METQETLQTLSTKETGLTQEDVKKRLLEYGPNELKKERGKSPVKLFIEQFADILIVILLVATLLSLALGEIYDAILIFAIVIASAVLGFMEEYRSEKAIEALKKMTAPTAMVLRDGREVKVDATEIVPGDIVLLYTGDKIPADARLIEAINLKTDEAPLTGESTPVNKDVAPLAENTGLNDRRNSVFTGTVVVYGRGKSVVTSTGMNTEFGKIAKMVQTTVEEETPLEKRMASVGKWLGIFMIVVCLMVAVIGILLKGRGVLEMILWGVSLAVAAVPEALPAIVTGALAVGVYRMAKVNSIVRRLPAVETLGCTSVICSDKTGTMTKGEMTVQRIYVNDKIIRVSGVGYEPEGEFITDDRKTDPTAEEELTTLLKVATLCNDAKLEKTGERWIIKGDPTEGALVVTAAKADLWKEELEKEAPRIGEIPFSSERKKMTTVHMVSGKKRVAFMKGAPELVLADCTKIFEKGKVRKITEEDRTKILKITEDMATQALRNLGFGFKEVPESVKTFDEKIENDLIFVGIMGMIDPPRGEVKDAINLCRKAGISVVMVTGDHKLTAIAVAKELGLISENPGEGKVMAGVEMDKIGEDELAEIVENVAIYARVSPEHKMRIVRAWKARERVVAMTGDGVNDAPALKLSDIGVSMGITGTEVTKEASDMVLADDNFASIVKAVKEGREIYDNIKKYLTYLLRCNVVEILVMFIVMMTCPNPVFTLGPSVVPPAVALTTIQILWVNLTTDGLPAIALGIDPGDPDLMEKKPRNPRESVFTRDVKAYLVGVPILMTTLLLIGYYMYHPWENEHLLIEARTQLFTAMVLMELANALSARSLKHTLFKVGVFKNRFLWLAVLSSLGLQLIVLYTPVLQTLFDVRTPEPFDWAIAILFTIITFATIETSKYIISKKRKE